MNDSRNILFPNPEERYNFDRMVIIFIGKEEHQNKKITCAISQEALDDHFHANGKDFLKTFQTHREKIYHAARLKYLANNLEPDGSILLKTEDIAL